MKRATIFNHANGHWVIRLVDTIRETVSYKDAEILQQAECEAFNFTKNRKNIRIHLPGSSKSMRLS